MTRRFTTCDAGMRRSATDSAGPNSLARVDALLDLRSFLSSQVTSPGINGGVTSRSETES